MSVKKTEIIFYNIFFSIAYKIYGFVYQSLYIFSLLPTQLINIYHMRGNLQKLVESCFFTFTCAGYATKLFLFLLHRKEIEEFFKRLHHPIFAPRRKEHLVVLKISTDTAKMNSIVYLALCLFTCVWWIMYPFVDSKQVCIKNGFLNFTIFLLFYISSFTFVKI